MVRVAIASKDGISVNEHFGRATFFQIYDLSADGYCKAEVRDAVAVCQYMSRHSVTNFERVSSLLADCDALLVSKIGEAAASYFIQKNVRVFEVQGEIVAVLMQLRENFGFAN